LYETHLPDIQTWLSFISSLAEYQLIVPHNDIRQRRGTTTFTAVVLMGSNPVFANRRFEADTTPDTDCQVYDPRTNHFLSLYPWMLMDHCPECYRQVIFLYDKCDEQHVVMREYPTSHTKRYAGELSEELQKWLS
jgi:hypothetical protein